ncbi:hypothetical protein [Pseudomonas phage Njord]|uniref:Uncharacterized protein n=1 Tax=Pseudomonas phage Njord TaxID=2163985 RepID=A0A2S1GML2_9CAUD|nr:hypothetical protein HOT08_gp05 [Pseudomonas phage Njord]AWD90593.1 hypothetical protein [Pseudomonas phage Njord]
MRIGYAFTDKIGGTLALSNDHQFVLKWADLSHGVTGAGVCSRCGFEPDDYEWDRSSFVSHCETMNDPL